jgi:hypothetical protein
LIESGQTLPAFDFHCPLMSLPLAFQTRVNTIPDPTPYLMADPLLRLSWQQRLSSVQRLRVGLVWRGRATHRNDRQRSLDLQTLVAALPTGCEYVSLQKEVSAQDNAILQAHGICQWGDQLHDLTDTAALCDLMDVVISVDTSVAHLAAALGKPTWILLSQVPDWRWLLDRNDSPWYRCVRLYRQSVAGEWSSALNQISIDLKKLGKL